MPGRSFRLTANWLFWSGLFVLGSVLAIWLEWQALETHPLFGFIGVSLWSGLCAIGYSLTDWLLRKSRR